MVRKKGREKRSKPRDIESPTITTEEITEGTWEFPINTSPREIVAETKDVSAIPFEPEEEQGITRMIETSERYKTAEFKLGLFGGLITFSYKRKPTIKKTIIAKSKRRKRQT